MRSEGLQRLTYDTLNGLGFVAAPISEWKLSHRGASIGFLVIGDADDTMEPGEEIRFYASALDDEGDPQIEFDAANSVDDIYRAVDFGDDNPFFLTAESGAQPALPTKNAAPVGSPAPPVSFRDTARLEIDQAYFPFDDGDEFYWFPTLSTATGTVFREHLVDLPDLATSTDPVDVRVRFQGRSREDGVDPDHTTIVKLQRQSGQVTLATDTQQWDDFALFTHDFTWTNTGGAGVTSPALVRLEVAQIADPACAPNCVNAALLDFIELTYARLFRANGDELIFEWEDETAEFVVTEFTTDDIEVFEITHVPGTPWTYTRLTGVSVTGDGPYQVRFRIEDEGRPDGSLREFLVVAGGAVKTPFPSDIAAVTPAGLKDNALQADYIVIGHPDILDLTPGGDAANWIAHRESPAGGSFDVEVVWIQDIIDEFNDGIWGPEAVQEFLRWVMSTEPGEGWADPKPTHVLLVGDGSFRYSGRESSGNYIPTWMLYRFLVETQYYASDTRLAAVVGDDRTPDLFIGRIPARNSGLADIVFQKTVDYETGTALDPSWRRHWLMVSDRSKIGPGENIEFENVNDFALSTRVGTVTSRHLRYEPDFWDPRCPGVAPEECPDFEDASFALNAEIIRSINGEDIASGAVLTQYVGHGSFEVWGDDAFWDERPGSPKQGAEFFDNFDELTFMLAHNCLTGSFHWCTNFCDPLSNVDSNLGQSWTFAPAGAVANMGPTGLSFNSLNLEINTPLWPAVNGPRKLNTVGEVHFATLIPQCNQVPTTNFVAACQFYALQGDPAVTLKFPFVDPADELNATAGNGQVQLDWIASDTANVTYQVQRRAVAPPIFAEDSYAPVGSTSDVTFTDSSVENAVTYQYALVAIDGDAFESRWSNFNEDCSGAGLDCVEATPLNDVKPQTPSGFSVSDPGIGNLLQLSWNANPEGDLSAYVVSWGTSPGVYTDTVTLEGDRLSGQAPPNRVSIAGLAEGQRVYFTIVAVNYSGLTSDPAGEISDFRCSRRSGCGRRASSTPCCWRSRARTSS